jgi:phosphate transport system ATP-binding protein
MHYGKIIEQGAPETVIKNPQSSQLKEYLVDGF